MKKYITKSLEDTLKLGRSVAKKLKPGAILALNGELGAGKTSFVQGLADGLNVPKNCYVSSPTFTILKVYEGDVRLFHFDFYRLNDPYEFEDLGFDDYLKDNGIVAIEWANKFEDLLPKEHYNIEFSVLGENKREIKIPKELL